MKLFVFWKLVIKLFRDNISQLLFMPPCVFVFYSFAWVSQVNRLVSLTIIPLTIGAKPTIHSNGVGLLNTSLCLSVCVWWTWVLILLLPYFLDRNNSFTEWTYNKRRRRSEDQWFFAASARKKYNIIVSGGDHRGWTMAATPVSFMSADPRPAGSSSLSQVTLTPKNRLNCNTRSIAFFFRRLGLRYHYYCPI